MFAILFIIILLCVFIIIYILKLNNILNFRNIKKKYRVKLYDKIAELQYNRLNEYYLDNNLLTPIQIARDNLLETSYSILDKIV